MLLFSAGVGHGQAEQHQQQQAPAAQVLFQDSVDNRVESAGPGPMSGLWSAAPVMQPHQLHPHQQLQLQQQLMLGAGHGNLGPIVGHQHQSPPGLGPLNMMIGGPGGQHVSMGHMFPVQSPPASTGQFLHLPGPQQQQPRQIGDTTITPNSTPGLQTPTPSATPPIINMENRDNNLFHNRGPVPGQDFETIGDLDPMMGWRGLQALQGGTIADMFGAGVDRQFGLFGGGVQGPGGERPGDQRHPGPPAPGFPGGAPLPVSGFNNMVAMAQAQENMMRLQQFQQQNPDFINKQQQQQLQQQFPGNPHIEMTRHFPGMPPPQCQSPSPNSFSLPPGPRPRPVGGDSSPPGFNTDSAIPTNISEEFSHMQQGPGKTGAEQQQPQQPQQPLVIGSWNDECEKDEVSVPGLPPLTAPPPSVPHNMSQPPPRFISADQEWGGTFQIPRGGGHSWGAVEDFQPVNDFKKQEKDKFDGYRHDAGGDGFRGRGRGGRGGRGAARGRGGFQAKPGMDHSKEKVQGKNAAIEETKAMLAKMRLEDKELMSKNRKGGDAESDNKPGIQPGAYRPRDNRPPRGGPGGYVDRGRGGAGGRGRGRGGPPQFGQHQPPIMRMPFIPGDFRTPPFPGRKLIF